MTNNGNIEDFFNRDNDFILEDDDSICLDIPLPEADMFDESDDNAKVEESIDTYQEAINWTHLKHFVEARGGPPALDYSLN